MMKNNVKKIAMLLALGLTLTTAPSAVVAEEVLVTPAPIVEEVKETPAPVVEEVKEIPAPAIEEATAEPTEEATAEPTEEATAEPTEEATAEPTEEATAEPTEEPATEAPAFTGSAKVVLKGEAVLGQKVTLKLEVSNYDGAYAIQWQSRSEGGSWKDISGEIGAEYEFVLNDETVENEYRAEITAA